MDESTQKRAAKLPHARIAVIIPVLNEEESIGRVLDGLPGGIQEVIVVDNGCTDRTSEIARACGARVIAEPRRGYGMACLAGMAALARPDIVVFLDGDFSDYPEEVAQLVQPIAEGRADLVLGSRVLGYPAPGALTLPQRFGNWLSCRLIRLFWGEQFTDLGPFRAIHCAALKRLGMDDKNFGWTVQMQIRAVKLGLRIREIPVRYRKRIGSSKISGTVRGVVGAGTKILYTIFRELLFNGPAVSKEHRERLIVFTRYPDPGRVKMRLIPALGTVEAANLQRRMTAHALARAHELQKMRGTQVEVRFEGGDVSRMGECFGPVWDYRSQGDGDLGERLKRAFTQAFANGESPVVVIGADCPTLTTDTLQSAFESLRTCDLVLGPAADGGYYLLGMRQMVPPLFDGVPWGSERVLAKTLETALNQGLSCHLLEELNDVDRPADSAPQHFSELRSGSPWLSVVIPARNEAMHISETLMRVANVNGVEIIVVDGQSSDGTAKIARSHCCRVLTSPPGRARQMNAGAAMARGEILLFLHADTKLPDGFVEQIGKIISQPGTVAGAFRLRIDCSAPAMRLVESLVNARSRLLQMPYGDQALFLKAEVFRQIGGFPDLPVMEDFELVRRLRRIGNIVLSASAVTTSPRSWQALGVVRTTLLNQLMVAGYLAKISPARLVRWNLLGCQRPSGFASNSSIPQDPTGETPVHIPPNIPM